MASHNLDQLRSLVGQWGELVGYQVTVRFQDGTGQRAVLDSVWRSRRSKQAEIVCDSRLLAAPANVQQTVLAHEVGHLATRSVVLFAAVGVVVSLLIGGAVTFWSIFLNGAVPSIWVLLPLVAVSFGCMPLIACCERRDEFAADRWAADTLDLPYTTRTELELAAVGLPGDTRPARLRDRVLASHPPAAVRVRRLATNH